MQFRRDSRRGTAVREIGGIRGAGRGEGGEAKVEGRRRSLTIGSREVVCDIDLVLQRECLPRAFSTEVYL